MNDEHILKIVREMPDLVNPTAIQESVENYLEEHPVEGIGTITKEEMLAILRGGDNA